MFTQQELIELFSCVHFTRHTAEQDFSDDEEQAALLVKLAPLIKEKPEWMVGLA